MSCVCQQTFMTSQQEYSQFVPNEILSILEDIIQNPKYPDDLLNVPPFGRWNVFGLFVKPHRLSVIWPLS